MIIGLVWAISTLALAEEPLSTEGRLNRSAYPLARYAEKYARLPKGVETELRAQVNQAVTPIRLAPAAWFRSTFTKTPSTNDRRKILESFNETEIWKCQGETCSGCPGNEISGCVLANPVAGGVGVVALIHPCLYGEGKCARGASTDLSAWVEKFVTGIAYYKSGLPKDGTAFRKTLTASGEWLRNTSRSVNQMLGACPGPYAADSLKFLLGLEAVTLPNPAILKCGQSYLEMLRGLPEKCLSLTKVLRSEWIPFTRSTLRASADILRCDAYCMKMLCRARDTTAVLALFSGKPVLLIGDGSCEGETPKRVGAVLREVLPRSLRAKLESENCLPTSEPTSSGAGGNGPEVLLVE